MVRSVARAGLGAGVLAVGCAADPPPFPDLVGSGDTTATSARDDADAPDVTTTTTAAPPSDESTSRAPDSTETGASDTGPPPAAMDRAFRINSARLVDPHAYWTTLDVTPQIDATIDDALNNPRDRASGTLQVGLVLSFLPLDQSDGFVGMLELGNADCFVPSGDVCTPSGDLYTTSYVVHTSGPCLTPDPNHLDEDYEAPNVPRSDCFVSTPVDLEFDLGIGPIGFEQLELSAELLGDPAGNLVFGVARGFLPKGVAEETIVTAAGISGPIADFLKLADADGDGWWVYFEFTAIAIEWRT